MTRSLIVVAACTRRRLDMLEHLLLSWRNLSSPAGTDVKFLVVENDQQPRSKGVVDRVLGEGGRYVLEPEVGIPFARNRAIDIAREMGASHLAFVDDDEECPSDWLIKLWAVAKDCDLAGGPQRITATESSLTYWQRATLSLLQDRATRRAQDRARLAEENKIQEMDLYTHNWIADLEVLAAHDLRFDESLRYSGGSDTAFSIAASNAGLRKGWAPDALVIDRWPPRRLSPKYLFQRVSAQTSQNYHRSQDPRRRV